MIGAIILTFVITTLSMLVLFMRNENKKELAEKNRIIKENDGLRRRIADNNERERCRRERNAYDKGLYDARETDALYRQCFKKYQTREQVDIMMNGEKEDV